MMTVANEKVVGTLNHLIVTCKDGLEGFHNAGAGVQNTELKRLFATYEQQRRKLMAELRPEVLSLGGDPEKGGTVSGAVHRGWLNLKQVLTGANDDAVVDEAERSEDIAVESYLAALKEDLPPAVRIIVLRQYDEVKKAHDRISALKKAQKMPA